MRPTISSEGRCRPRIHTPAMPYRHVIVEGTPDEIRGNTLVHDLYLGRHHPLDG